MKTQKTGRPRPEDPGQAATQSSMVETTKRKLPHEDELVNRIKERILNMPIEKALAVFNPAFAFHPGLLEAEIRTVVRQELRRRK